MVVMAVTDDEWEQIFQTSIITLKEQQRTLLCTVQMTSPQEVSQSAQTVGVRKSGSSNLSQIILSNCRKTMEGKISTK